MKGSRERSQVRIGAQSLPRWSHQSVIRRANLRSPYCLIGECCPDGVFAAVDPISTDRSHQLAFRTCGRVDKAVELGGFSLANQGRKRRRGVGRLGETDRDRPAGCREHRYPLLAFAGWCHGRQSGSVAIGICGLWSFWRRAANATISACARQKGAASEREKAYSPSGIENRTLAHLASGDRLPSEMAITGIALACAFSTMLTTSLA